MMAAVRLILATVAALALPAGARAAETPLQEFGALARCAIAVGVYEDTMKPGGWSDAPAADRALYARVSAVEPALEARTNALADRLPADQVEEVVKTVTEEMRAVLARVPDTTDVAATAKTGLAYYRSGLESCIARGETLKGL